MPSTQYDTELTKLGATYERALNVDVTSLKNAVASASAASILGVGSGGSYTVASLLCNLHETYTGRVSRPSTPLEIICNPTLVATSPVFFISAEGKNPDIVEALERARSHSARVVHVLTNRGSSDLVECAHRFTDIATHVFELVDKDGYLATNSLLLDAVLIARAYEELDGSGTHFPVSLAELQLDSRPLEDWLADSAEFAVEAANRGNLIVVFSPLLRPVAADLESKLSEAALIHCQMCDLRSFAHGRHLWLAERPEDCAILALVDPTLAALWEASRRLFPSAVPTLTMPFRGARPRDLVAGLVAQMRFVSSIANQLGRDPGRPRIEDFGRTLHYVALRDLIAAPVDSTDRGVHSKYEVLGASWPLARTGGSMLRAQRSFTRMLELQPFRCLIFDYDGTLCHSQRHDGAPPKPVIEQLERLISHGVHLGIATGRGGSVIDRLREGLAERFWPEIRVGLYNCGDITALSEQQTHSTSSSEFLSHVSRIVGRLKSLGAPIETIRTTHPHQVSVRFFDGVDATRNWFMIADALRQDGLDPSRVVHSKHSVDILGTGVNKSHLVADFIQACGLHPHQILTIGDQGAWPGNDAALLEHRFSLSVDVPSRRVDRGWNLAPAHKRDVAATLWYLEHCVLLDRGSFRLELGGADPGVDAL